MKIRLFIGLLVLSLQVAAQRTIQQEQMKLGLSRLFVSGHMLTFDILLFNHSPLGYQPQYIKFFIRERHLMRRMAVQEREILPLYPMRPSEILADSSLHIMLLFHQFTVPRTKELVIAMKEKDGSRDLALHITGHRFMKMIRTTQKSDQHPFINEKKPGL